MKKKQSEMSKILKQKSPLLHKNLMWNKTRLLELILGYGIVNIWLRYARNYEISFNIGTGNEIPCSGL